MRFFPTVNQVVVPLDVQVARMRAEPLVREEFRRIDDLVIFGRRERLATVRSIDAVLLEPSHAFFAADGSLAVRAPSAVIVLRSQVAVIEHSHAIHRITLRLRDFFEFIAVDMEVDAPVVKAQDLRGIVARARENLEFGRRAAQHQVRRLGNAVVGDVRVAVHLAVGAVHSHLERHDHVGILREHGSELFHMAHHPLVFGSHVASAVVPRVITDTYNYMPAKTADIVECCLQHIQRIFGEILVLAANRITLSTGGINRKPCVTAEFRNLRPQVQQLAIRFFNRLAARGF